MTKITIVGAGNVGSQVAFYTTIRNLANEIVLMDIHEDLAKGKALDILHANPLFGSNTKIIGTNNYELSKDSDVVIITAGSPRKPGMLRNDLIPLNSRILSSIIPNIVTNSPNCILVIVTNPVDVMTYLAYKLSKLPRQRVIGMAGVLDTTRFKTFISEHTNADVNKVDAMVIGSHGKLCLPLINKSQINGTSIFNHIEKPVSDLIVQKVKNGGTEIVDLLKTGSAFFAPAVSIVSVVESILRDNKNILTCSVLLEGEYNVNDLFIGVPVILGKEGIEKIIELDLSEDEKLEFNKSILHIKESIKQLIF